MKIFLDTEFTGLHQNTSLISFALVAENGYEFYAEISDYDSLQISDWIRDNVINKLEGSLPLIASIDPNSVSIKTKDTKKEIAQILQIWFKRFDHVEIWADVLAYDWMLFCELFGGALNIPENIFYTPFDLATLFKTRGLIQPMGKYENDISRYGFVGADISKRHNSLHDARVERDCFNKLMNHG